METATSLQGPGIPYGSAGVLEGFEENEIKGYDNFGLFVAAVEKAGLGDALKSGEYTVFAPVDSAFANFKGEVTADLLKYHVVPGKVSSGSIGKDIETLEGKSLTYSRKFRKTFLDDAIIGMGPSGAATGESYPIDVACDNGLIHAIDVVLVPGWTNAGADAGMGGVV